MKNKRIYKRVLPLVLMSILIGCLHESRISLADPQVSERMDDGSQATVPPAPSVLPTPTDSVITPDPTVPPATFPPSSPTPSGSALPTLTPNIVDQGPCGPGSQYTLDDTGVLRITGTGVILEQSFRGRTDIRAIVVDDRITGIEGAVFMDCRSLTTVTLPGALQSIGDCAFSGCTALTTVKFPETVSTIGAQAFFNTALTGVILPGGVTKVGIQSFANNGKLVSVKLEGSGTKVGWGAFMNLAASAVVTVPVNFSDTNGLKDAVNGTTRIQYGDSGVTPTTVPTVTIGPITPVAPVTTPKPTSSAQPTYTPMPTEEPIPTVSPEPTGGETTPSKPVIKKAVSKKKNQIQVQWKKVENGDGYQIRFSTDKNFKKKEMKTVAKTKITLKHLNGKKYFVAVRAYFVGEEGIVYGPWSKKKKVTMKK